MHGLQSPLQRGGVRAQREASSAAGKANAAAAWAVTAIANGSKRCERYGRMDCHHRCEGQLACAERSIECSKRSERSRSISRGRGLKDRRAKGGVRALREASSAASKTSAAAAWTATGLARGSKQCERYGRMDCHHRCEERLACAERSIQCSKRSERYSRIGRGRGFQDRRACAERGVERSTQSKRDSHTSCRRRWKERHAYAERSIWAASDASTAAA